MIVHENAELLSSFVDGELEAPVRRQVEEHLAGCPPCRERIGGLRRVVEELHSLQSVAPPAALERRVHRAIRFDRARGSGLRRGEETLRRWTNQPLLLPLFGVVTAMAVLLYLFTAWSGSGEGVGTRLVVGPSEGVGAGAERTVAGRVFEWQDERWVERGLDPAAVTSRLDGRAGEELPVDLEFLRELEGVVVLEREGEVLEVVLPP